MGHFSKIFSKHLWLGQESNSNGWLHVVCEASRTPLSSKPRRYCDLILTISEKGSFRNALTICRCRHNCIKCIFNVKVIIAIAHSKVMNIKATKRHEYINMLIKYVCSNIDEMIWLLLLLHKP